MEYLKILKSKTVLFGLLLTLASVVEMLLPYFPPQYVGVIGTAVGISVLVLRFLTTVPLSEK